MPFFSKLHEALDEYSLKEITKMLTKEIFEYKKEARKVDRKSVV